MNDILGTAADQGQQLHHLLDALSEEGSLGIVVDSTDLSVALLCQADCQRDAECIGIFHGHGTFYADNIS